MFDQSARLVIPLSARCGFELVAEEVLIAAESDYDLRVSIGSGTAPGRPITIAPATDIFWWASLQTGIDGHGDAIVTWSRFGGRGDHGLFEAIHVRH